VQKERTKAKYEVDETDRKVLHLLNENSSLSYLEIAQKLGLTIDIIRYRIKNLLEKNIIIRFFSEVSLPKLGYTEYLYKIRLKNVSQEKMDSIKRRIQSDENVTYAFFDITGFNLIFACAFKAPEDIDHLSRSIRKKYSEIIDEQEHFMIKEQILFNLYPKGLL
jgi:DNA-binding Lrp family transcriptional regulator